MSWIQSKIKKSDYLGIQASLIFEENDKNVKSLFGGILSIIIVILIVLGGGYFFLNFITRQDFTLVSNSSQNFQVVHNKINELPFMIRLSNSYSKIYPNNYHHMKMKLFSFDESISDEQVSIDISMEECRSDLDLFKNYYDIFKDISNFNSYYCPKWDSVYDLYGVYGSTYFRYILIYISYCSNEDPSIKNVVCEDYNVIYSELESTYIDFITLTNSIDHYNQKPNKIDIYKSRIPASITVFKRIFLSLQKIIYHTDVGYIFESNKNKEFYKIPKYSVDIDLRKENDNSFIWFTIINHEYTITYKRSYMKAQTLLANIGGIIKGLTLIGVILNYPVTNNLYNLSLINTIYDKDYSFSKKSIDQSEYLNYVNNKKKNKWIVPLNSSKLVNNKLIDSKGNHLNNSNFINVNRINSANSSYSFSKGKLMSITEENENFEYDLNKLNDKYEKYSLNNSENNKHNSRNTDMNLDNKIDNFSNCVSCFNTCKIIRDSNIGNLCEDCTSKTSVKNKDSTTKAKSKFFTANNNSKEKDIDKNDNIGNTLNNNFVEPNPPIVSLSSLKNNLSNKRLFFTRNENIGSNTNINLNTNNLNKAYNISSNLNNKLKPEVQNKLSSTYDAADDSNKIKSNDNKDANNKNNGAIFNIKPKTKLPLKKLCITNEESKTKNVFLIKNIFSLSNFLMLDPFQYCLNQNKKDEYYKRLRKAENYLKISTVLSLIQEFSVIKKLLLEENQIKLIENIYKTSPDVFEMSEAYNNIVCSIENNNDFMNNNISLNTNRNTTNFMRLYNNRYNNDFSAHKSIREKEINSKIVKILEFY